MPQLTRGGSAISDSSRLELFRAYCAEEQLPIGGRGSYWTGWVRPGPGREWAAIGDAWGSDAALALAAGRCGLGEFMALPWDWDANNPGRMLDRPRPNGVEVFA